MKNQNLVEMVWRSVEKYPDNIALKWKENNTYQTLTYRNFWNRIQWMAAGLYRYGVRKDTKVGILSNNQYKWPIADLAIGSLGAVSVPIYPSLPADHVNIILKQADCEVVFVEDEIQLQKVIHGQNDVHTIIHMGSDKYSENNGNIVTFSSLEHQGKEHPLDRWTEIWKAIGRDQLMTIIHTSGTTGVPKGAMLTHGNFLSNIEGIQIWCMEARHDDIFLSYLPLAHVFERMAGQFMPLSVGATIAYAESLETIPQNLLEVRPTVMTSVPRLFEKIYARVQEEIQSGTPIRRAVFEWALKIGEKRYELYTSKPADYLMMHDLPPDLKWKWKIADKLVFQKIKSQLGGRLRGMISGGAALNPDIARFFWAIDVPVLEGYGLTETSPVISVNPFSRARIGTVGLPLPNLEVSIAEDGEIWVRGPNVMQGYYRNEEATAKQFQDGWLKTGDLGEINEEGYLKITDRKKRLLILSTGKNVSPQPVENAICASLYINQCCLIGQDRKYTTVLIEPDFEQLIPWAEKKNLPADSREKLVECEEVKALLQNEITQAVKHFPRYERPKKAWISGREWTEETGEITPSLKVRTHEIEKIYKDEIAQMYGDVSHPRMIILESAKQGGTS
ncbi:long-chain fatty acid--CoA ligase [Thermoactinomyces sp. CICC 23799]|jgi:long-chain acyl-CoA synthetase|uniref:AMP-dependent synthetase/ligase n=1 Tax=Thermoactinomyces sp. CICC 23799 TaxID=2767429 RepID=UPI0018DB162D|nr:long-chain fatty acid--CoA ligase [Thermoactinomyces sp. CICC 23799]MBH8601363.1 long-chain fatty acid--CoA ligase [Thermoactinomyces sp. CICC 23799]